MRNLALIQTIVLLCLLSLNAYSQRVKYKDIFALLNTKQYEAAEPFLRKYVAENTDQPSSYLFMGIIYHEKSTQADALKQTKLMLSHMDSAIFFYDKANKAITEKEIKKNDEYYQMYNRRDLRTGQFGVKLSDVQFDIEKRIEGLRERIDGIKLVKHYFSFADTLYKRSNALYRSLQASYPGEKELYLRGDESTSKLLAALAARYDSCIKAFEQYKSSLSSVGKTGYNQSLTKNEIRNFKQDGASPADFYKDDIQVWDYKSFAQKTRQVIEKEIIPIREHLVAYDIEINKLREKMGRDSISVRNDLTKLIDRLLMEHLTKYDPKPLPMQVFAVKIADLDYKSTLMEYLRTDTTNLHLKLKIIQEQVKTATLLDSVATQLVNTNIDAEAENYAHFITNTYNKVSVLQSFVKTMKDYAAREKRVRETNLQRSKESLRWIVSNADSIPLFTSHPGSKFKPLSVVDEKYTSGLVYVDSLNITGYFYTITPSRRPDVKIAFPVEKAYFKQSLLSSLKSITYSDTNGQIYFALVYSDKPTADNKYPATLAKIYRSDGLAWSVNYLLSFAPKEIEFRSETGELMIRADAQETVIDKNGKVMR